MLSKKLASTGITTSLAVSLLATPALASDAYGGPDQRGVANTLNSVATSWRPRLLLASARAASGSTASAGHRAGAPIAPRQINALCEHDGNVTIFLKNNHTSDFAVSNASGFCTNSIKHVGVELSASKNGTKINELTTSAQADNTPGVDAPTKIYDCNNCAGSWLAGLSSVFKKYQNGQLIDPPNNGTCSVIVDGNENAVGWACSLVDSLFVP